MLIVILICFSVVELVTKKLYLPELTGVRKTDMIRHHMLRPNTKGFETWGGSENMYYVNSLGLRDKEIRDVKLHKTNKYRVLFLGDSFTEGIGLDYEETSAAVFEKNLLDRNVDVEVLNGGILSYAPLLEYFQLRDLINKGLELDLVVLMLDLSDVQDEVEYNYWIEDRFAEWADVWVKQMNKEEWLRKWQLTGLYTKSYFFRFIINSLFESHTEKKYDPSSREHLYLQQSVLPWAEGAKYEERHKWIDDLEIYERWGKMGVEYTKKDILKIRDLCEENNLIFMMVIYPWSPLKEIIRVPPPREVLFKEFSEDNGIIFLSLYPVFYELDNWREYYIPNDSHWTPKGAKLVGDELYNMISMIYPFTEN